MTRTITIEQEFHVRENGRERHMHWGTWHGAGFEPVASDGPAEYGRIFDLVNRVARAKLARDATIAWIGCGFAIGPRLCNIRPWGMVTIYELYPEVAQWVTDNYPDDVTAWTFELGDYKDSLPGNGSYDCIVYDLAEPADEELLRAHLAPGGKLILGG